MGGRSGQLMENPFFDMYARYLAKQQANIAPSPTTIKQIVETDNKILGAASAGRNRKKPAQGGRQSTMLGGAQILLNKRLGE